MGSSNLEKNSPDRLRLAPGWVRRNLGYPVPKEKRKVRYESHPLMCNTITIPVLTIHTHGMKNTVLTTHTHGMRTQS